MASRYHRQEILPRVGESGQARLARSHAAVVGLGALGCAIADHLVRAGVGTLTIVDRDLVDLTNLQRQSLYTEADANEGLPKAEAARRRLAAVNAEVALRSHIADCTHRNVGELLGSDVPPGVVLDGTDNFETRYLLNDFAVSRDIPFIYGGVVGTQGMQMTIRPGRTPCLRCVFQDPPAPGSQPTCDSAGVLGPVVAIVGACQAADAIRILLGQGTDIAPTLLEFDIWEGRRRRLDLAAGRRDDCPCCAERRFDFLEGDGASVTEALCGQDAVQVTPPSPMSLDLESATERLRAAATGVESRPFMVRATLPESRTSGDAPTVTLFRDGRAIFSGVETPEQARTLYARYIGL